MSADLTTAPWGETAVVTLVLGGVLGGLWWFAGFWERVWVESLQSRAVDRRFLRWQRGLFRGRYPLGHWRKPWSLAHVRFLTAAMRGILVVIGAVYVFALAARLLK